MEQPYVMTELLPTDSGNRDFKEKGPLLRTMSKEEIEKEAKQLIEKNGGNWALIVRTKPYQGKPGGWYIKGYNELCSHEEILARLYSNIQPGAINPHPRRECFLIWKQ